MWSPLFLCDCINDSNFEAASATLGELESSPPALRQALRLVVARGQRPDADFAAQMLAWWCDNGWRLRDIFGRDAKTRAAFLQDDLLLTDALRLLLPAYEGPDLTVYRGELVTSRQHRSYGISWTTDLQVATNHYRSKCENVGGYALLLQADAPKHSIISAVRHRDLYGEKEVLIDRRYLGRVLCLSESHVPLDALEPSL